MNLSISNVQVAVRIPDDWGLVRRLLRLSVCAYIVAVCCSCTGSGTTEDSGNDNNPSKLPLSSAVIDGQTFGDYSVVGQIIGANSDNLATDGKYLFATDDGASGSGRLKIIDLSNFSEKAVLDSIPSVVSVKANSPNDVYFDSVGLGLVKVDLLDPVRPVLNDRIHTPQGSIDFVVRGNVLFEAVYSKGIFAWDISDPVQPKELGHLELKDNSQSMPYQARALAISGNVLLAATRDGGLFFVDIAHPEAMRVLSRYPQNRSEDVTVWDVGTDGTMAYLAEGARVEILNIVDPSAPIQIAVVDLQKGFAGKVNINQNHAAFALEDGGVLLHQIDSPATRENMILIPTEGIANDALYIDGGVYVATDKNILKLFKTAKVAP